VVETRKTDVPDMSIDELSAAIDAHMQDVKVAPKKAEEPKPTSVNPPTTVTKTTARPDIVASQQNSKSSKIETKKDGYIGKSGDSPEESKQVATESDGLVSSGTVELKPIDHNTPNSLPKVEPQTSDAPKAPGEKIADVVARKIPINTEQKQQSAVPPPVEPAKKSTAVSESDEKKSVPEEVEPIQSPVVAPILAAAETKTVAKEPETENHFEKEPVTAPTTLPKGGNDIEELSAQIVENEELKEDEPKSDTLRTFDTKQYHIPIKPSHHHRAGSSFMVFAAVLAAILATLYVLNELEIIDLAALLYSN